MAEPQSQNAALTADPVEKPPTHYFTIASRGKTIAGGVSGLVERLPNGHAIKSAWPGDDKNICEEDMDREARAYQRLFECFGAHERFVKSIAYDESEHALTMEFMSNGTLREYLEANNSRVPQDQRHQWILAMAQGMEMLHSANILHCDFNPRNMLLDERLEVKVADFGCVAIESAKSSAGGCVRFYPPRVLKRKRFEADDDLFALGSSIFEVLTGKPPYEDLETRPIQKLYWVRQFPDLTGLDLADIIRDCWLFRGRSACDIHQRLVAAVPLRL